MNIFHTKIFFTSFFQKHIFFIKFRFIFTLLSPFCYLHGDTLCVSIAAHEHQRTVAAAVCMALFLLPTTCHNKATSTRRTAA